MGISQMTSRPGKMGAKAHADWQAQYVPRGQHPSLGEGPRPLSRRAHIPVRAVTKPGLSTPPGLGPGGTRLWASVASEMVLRPDEVLVLEHACRTVDLLARIDEALTDAPLTVKGSMGQLVEHPLVSESRAQRATLARLLAQLKLIDDEERVAVQSQRRTRSARAAAQARWYS